jgi:hypothetical protein
MLVYENLLQFIWIEIAEHNYVVTEFGWLVQYRYRLSSTLTPLSFFGVFVASALAAHGNIVSYFATGLSETCAMFIHSAARQKHHQGDAG